MSSLTGSFQRSNLPAASLSMRRSRVKREQHSPNESFVRFAQSAIYSVPNIEEAPAIPGLETAARWAQVLKRPSEPTRTANEEIEEERLNALTHGLGLAVSVAAFSSLLYTAALGGETIRLASCAVYGVTLILMYAASTSLHAAQQPTHKLRFQLCDHISIYLLIAGTYTPFMAILLPGTLGWTLLGCVWALAAIGIVIKLKCAARLEETSPLPYVGLGWLVLAAIKPLMAVLPCGGIVLLFAGGVSYSVGVIFYCRDDKPYFHAIWHLFVMAGTACHFSAVYFYVAIR